LLASSSISEAWPDLPYELWRDTCVTLHLYTQIVGKIRVVCTPWLNHSWHVVLHLTARGLTTTPIPFGHRVFQIDFDFIDHVLVIQTSDGKQVRLSLSAQPVADFYADVLRALTELGISLRIHALPNEIADAVPFSSDRTHRSYDREYVQRFWRVLLQIDRVFKYFRTGFNGKASPVHFFWGSFDLAVTRFSGRRAPAHPGGVPHLPDSVVREAYSHEVSSAGFWPGGGLIDYPAFYSYAFPEPDGFRDALVLPTAAFYHDSLREFLLPYEAVRTSANPDEMLLEFLKSTYEAAANAGKWERSALECPFGRRGEPAPERHPEVE
jgi:hypothetical protein